MMSTFLTVCALADVAMHRQTKRLQDRQQAWSWEILRYERLFAYIQFQHICCGPKDKRHYARCLPVLQAQIACKLSQTRFAPALTLEKF
jgi:hypothetical protein